MSLTTLIAVLSLSVIAGTVSAQSPEPAPPNFTIKTLDGNAIQLVIENQAFTSSNVVNSIMYYYRVKDHYSNQWMEMRDYQLQSTTSTTLITIPSVPADSLFPQMINNMLNNSTVLDFQVRAKTGYYAISNVSGPPAFISPAPQQWHTEMTFNESESSEWSSTQTFSLTEKTVVNPSPTAVPEIPLPATLLAMVIVASAGAVLFGKKLPSNVNKTRTSKATVCSLQSYCSASSSRLQSEASGSQP